MVPLHNRILLGHIKEINLTFCDSMDGPGGHYASEMSQSEKDKYTMISLICEI